MKSPSQKAADAHEAMVENQLALVYGDAAKRTPGSGNNALSSGDVRVPEQWVVECKTTAADSISVKQEWFRKVRKEGFMGGVRSMLALRFNHDRNKTYYMLEDTDLLNLLKCEKELNELRMDIELEFGYRR